MWRMNEPGACRISSSSIVISELWLSQFEPLCILFKVFYGIWNLFPSDLWLTGTIQLFHLLVEDTCCRFAGFSLREAMFVFSWSVA